RACNFSFNTSTSNAAHMIYPTSIDIINKLVLGNSTRTAVNITPSISNGLTVIIPSLLRCHWQCMQGRDKMTLLEILALHNLFNSVYSEILLPSKNKTHR